MSLEQIKNLSSGSTTSKKTSRQDGKILGKMSLEEMDHYWNEAKKL